MADVSCGLVGCGAVGSAVVRLWDEPGRAPGARLKSVAVRDRSKRRDTDLRGLELTEDAWRVVRDDEIAVVVEATGDTELAYALAVESLARGKSFITAGKSLVARHGVELEATARARGVAFRYEAAAGGALPIVALLRLGLSPGPVRGFEGVLNGTCNFVLSRLGEGLSFGAALESARRRGLAEADSRRDTSGLDSAEKLALLARLCGVRVDPGAVPTRGIDGLDAQDLAFGRARGWSLRLLARFRDEGDRVLAEVAPAFVPRDSLLASAEGEENAVVLDGGPAGPLGLVARGAGGLPTAAAVLSDLRSVLRGEVGPPPAIARVAVPETDPAPVPHYLRLLGLGGSEIAAALAGAGVGLGALLHPSRGQVQVLTAPAPAHRVAQALAAARAPEAIWVAVRPGPEPLRRPHPAAGVFEARSLSAGARA